MLAQLKTVVLIKEAIKLAFFRLVEYLEHGFDYRFKMARNKVLSSETRQSILVLRNEGYSMREVAKKLRISYRRLTSPELRASLNSTLKTPVSTSTVKRRLWDAGLLDRVAKKKPYLRLTNKINRLRWAKEHKTLDKGTLPKRPASLNRLFTVDIETGVLRVLFNEAGS